MISYHIILYFRYNLLIVFGGNGCKNAIKDNVELKGYGKIMKVKDNNHHGRVKTTEPKE